LTSAASFALGAALSLLVTAIAPEAGLIPLFSGISLVLFALLVGLAARTGGAGVSVGAIRVLFCGALTTGVEMLFGTTA
jgi:hypothetical protein